MRRTWFVSTLIFVAAVMVVAALAFLPHASSRSTRAATVEGADAAKGGEAEARGEDPAARRRSTSGFP